MRVRRGRKALEGGGALAEALLERGQRRARSVVQRLGLVCESGEVALDNAELAVERSHCDLLRESVGAQALERPEGGGRVVAHCGDELCGRRGERRRPPCCCESMGARERRREEGALGEADVVNDVRGRRRRLVDLVRRRGPSRPPRLVRQRLRALVAPVPRTLERTKYLPRRGPALPPPLLALDPLLEPAHERRELLSRPSHRPYPLALHARLASDDDGARYVGLNGARVRQGGAQLGLERSERGFAALLLLRDVRRLDDAVRRRVHERPPSLLEPVEPLTSGLRASAHLVEALLGPRTPLGPLDGLLRCGDELPERRAHIGVGGALRGRERVRRRGKACERAMQRREGPCAQLGERVAAARSCCGDGARRDGRCVGSERVGLAALRAQAVEELAQAGGGGAALGLDAVLLVEERLGERLRRGVDELVEGGGGCRNERRGELVREGREGRALEGDEVRARRAAQRWRRRRRGCRGGEEREGARRGEGGEGRRGRERGGVGGRLTRARTRKERRRPGGVGEKGREVGLDVSLRRQSCRHGVLPPVCSRTTSAACLSDRASEERGETRRTAAGSRGA